MSAVIEAEKLTKTYESSMFTGQDVYALKELDLAVNEGEIFAYLGPNGSGKTTTIKMLLGLIFSTSGNLRVFGTEDIASSSVKSRIGYVPEGAYYPEFLRGEEVLSYYGQLYGLGGADLKRRIDQVIETVGLGHARKRTVRGYSKGMRQRVGLAQALLSNPQLLILDEPTTGLDPIARKEIRDILKRLREEGKTLFISSHELLEIELISDRIGILFEGVLQRLGTLKELLSDRDLSFQVHDASDEKLAKLRDAKIEADDAVEGTAVLRIPSTMTIYDAMDLCRTHQLKVQTVAPRRETLEELFVRVVGEARQNQVKA